jgi:hypothetical protein
LPCGGCGGCGTLQDAVDGATSIFVNVDNGSISGTLSTISPFTESSQKCVEGGECNEYPEWGYFCCNLSSNNCGVALSWNYVPGQDGFFQNVYSVHATIQRIDGECVVNFYVDNYWSSGGPDGGQRSGYASVPLEDIIGTHSIPTSGWYMVNGEESPWNVTTTVTIS